MAWKHSLSDWALIHVGESVAQPAMVLINVGAGEKRRLIGSNRHRLRHLFFDSRMQRSVGKHFFKRQRLVSSCNRRSARKEISKGSSYYQQDSDN